MNEEKIYEMLKKINLESAYDHYEEGIETRPPYIVYRYTESNNFSADGITYVKINEMEVELYTEKKDLNVEKNVESVLSEHGFFYEKEEMFIKTEKLYMVNYKMEVIME